MLTNGTLYRIDTRNAATTGGAASWTNGSTIAVKVYVKDVQLDAEEIAQLKGRKKAVMRVQPAAIAGMALAVEQRVLVAGDGEAAVLYRVRQCGLNAKGSLSFFECELLQD